MGLATFRVSDEFETNTRTPGREMLKRKGLTEASFYRLAMVKLVEADGVLSNIHFEDSDAPQGRGSIAPGSSGPPIAAGVPREKQVAASA